MYVGVMVKQDADRSMGKDLLVVGPGVLGRLVAERWLQVLCLRFKHAFQL